MPLLDCKCEDCGEVYEYSKFRSDDFPSCPKCQSTKYEKLISKGTSAQFKGPGFFVNDYPKKD